MESDGISSGEQSQSQRFLSVRVKFISSPAVIVHDTGDRMDQDQRRLEGAEDDPILGKGTIGKRFQGPRMLVKSKVLLWDEDTLVS